MSKNYIVNCYTCQHNGQETCKGCNTLLNGEDEPYENWQLREDLETKDQRIAELEEQLKNSIRPKFKIGQEVWVVLDDVVAKDVVANNWFLCSLEKSRLGLYEDYLFATKEEAQAKLKELQGEIK